MRRVVIVGGGFGGLNCARALQSRSDLSVTLIDRRNYHLFQPLLYQVAMAGLSPGDIASPIRGLFSADSNVHVVQAEVEAINAEARRVLTSAGAYEYDYLVLAAGAQHAYFGKDEWEDHAPGLKTLEQATEIRRRVLSAFEQAECERDQTRRRALLTFVVVGGGPTGVELAGAIGEMTRYTLARDFRNIDPKLTRIVLIEAGPRILPSFDPQLSSRATSELERLGVQLWTNSAVTRINADGVFVGQEHLASASVIWAAGVQASPIGKSLHGECDRQGRVMVRADLSVPGYPEILVIGDQSHFKAPYMERPLPGVASVAIQQGKHAARTICADLDGERRKEFRYLDKGQMATIGRRRAVMQKGSFRSAGVFAWLVWLLVHIYFLSGFKNRLFVLMQWSWSYLTFARGTRLIVEKEWRSFKKAAPAPAEPAAAAPAPASAAAPAPASAPVPAPASAAAAPEPAPASKAPESIRPPAPKVSEVPPAPAPSVSRTMETRPPMRPTVAEEPVTRTWQAPNPPDLWEEPTTLYPSRE
ncbi:MAG TPA: NAD(P)/FAD-dependent oxidoreductase [Polyangiaceae bacterium]|nr:NAD(P)/FAD-dependent oxidoreductase [Polyangiaceae bacterium]